MNAVRAVGTGNITTTRMEISHVSPGPDSWIDLNVNVPRSGQYSVAMNYASEWPPADQPGHVILTANGKTETYAFAKTAGWAVYANAANIASLPLTAGPNTVRVALPDAAANIMYFDFARTGDIVLPPSTDINTSGATDIVVAVIYARRLQGLDAGPTPDLTGDGQSNQEDVRRILRVAGGLA